MRLAQRGICSDGVHFQALPVYCRQLRVHGSLSVHEFRFAGFVYQGGDVCARLGKASRTQMRSLAPFCQIINQIPEKIFIITSKTFALAEFVLL
jgi:hypothetical protein